MKTTIWLARLIPAVILFQTLYFKFTAAPESVAIFTTLGAEPWGRIGSGIVELVAGILLLIPATSVVGAILVMGTMLGAIMSHLFVLGIEIQGDGGTLFGLALVCLCSSLLCVYLQKQSLLRLWVKFVKR